MAELVVALDATIVNVSLPRIQADLAFSSTNLSWVPNAYTLAAGGLLLLGGRVGDIVGRRLVFVLGVAVFTLASVFAGLAPGAGWLLAARALQGVGAAFTAPNCLALITTNFREGRERDRAVGVYAAVTGSGAALGMIGGGMIATWAAWPWIFFINLQIGVAVAVAAFCFLAESPHQRHRLDLLGALASTVGIGALVYGFVRAASEGWGDAVALGAFAVALVLTVAFVLIETRSREALTPLRLLLHRNRAGAYVVSLLMLASMLGMLFFQSQFLQEVFGYSPLRAGLAFIPMSLVLLPATQLAARLMARAGPRPVIAAGAVVATGATAWISRNLSVDSTYAGSVLGPLLLIGLGTGLMLVPLTAVAVYKIPSEEAGAGSSLLSVTNQVGGSLGLAVLVSAFGVASRHAARHPVGSTAAEQARYVLAHGVSGAFSLAAVFLAAAVVLTLVVINAKVSEVAPPRPGAGDGQPADQAAAPPPSTVAEAASTASGAEPA